MKIFYKVLLMGVFALSATQAIAASVTGLNTFSSGTPALASEVNDNFTNVKSAVDDNDSRLTNLESGAVTVHSLDFKLTGGSSCTQFNDYTAMHFPSGNNCTALTSIALPHNRKLTSLSCYVYDNSGNSLAIYAWLQRSTTSGNTMTVSTIFVTPTSINSTSNQNISDNTLGSPSYEVIDNTNYSYHLAMATGAANAGTLLKLRSCTVNYI